MCVLFCKIVSNTADLDMPPVNTCILLPNNFVCTLDIVAVCKDFFLIVSFEYAELNLLICTVVHVTAMHVDILQYAHCLIKLVVQLCCGF